MKKLKMFIFYIMLVPCSASAGEIYGYITNLRGQPVVNVKVEVFVNQKTTYATKSDKHGSYRIYVKETGRYTLKVHFQDQIPTIVIYSSNSSAQYNLILDKDSKGTYLLRRK